MKSPETFSDTLIDESIAAEKTEGGKQSVDDFTGNVEARVQETTDALREQFGEEIDSVIGDVDGDLRDYKRTISDRLDTDEQVGDTASKGAAAWNDKSNNEVVYDHTALERDADHDYWQGVRDHEAVHQVEQAATFNRPEITYPGGTMAVSPVLVEWHAISGSGQSPADLTPAYIAHKQAGDRLAAWLGSSSAIEAALKSGDMQTLQRMIVKKQLKEQGIDLPEKQLEAVAA